MKKHQSKTPPSRSNPIHTARTSQQHAEPDTPSKKTVEIGGPKGPEPTRYGDWENSGRCTDF